MDDKRQNKYWKYTNRSIDLYGVHGITEFYLAIAHCKV